MTSREDLPSKWCPRCQATVYVDDKGRCIPCRAALLARKRNERSGRYARLKAAGLCIDCAGPKETGLVRCDYCHDVEKLRQRGKRKTKKHRATCRKRSRRYREAQQSNGLCMFCPRAADRGTKCTFHADLHIKATKEWRTRQKLGIPAPPRELEPIEVEMPTAPYVPLDEQAQSAKLRVLRRMRWMDWSNTQEIGDAMGVSTTHGSREGNTVQAALGRLVKDGLLEKRLLGSMRWHADYRITKAGIAAVNRERPKATGGGAVWAS